MTTARFARSLLCLWF